jgi:hypothetical protein
MDKTQKEKSPTSAWYKGLSEKDKQEAKQLSQISMWMDSYDDIFSDFDPRPSSQRSISDDFLIESRRAAKDKVTGTFELKLLIPDNKRDKHEEKIIKKRLKRHFRKRAYLAKKEISKTRKEGIKFILFGVTLMFIASLLLFIEEEKNLLLSFMIVLVEPAGWFMFWEGLNSVIFKPRIHETDLEFAEKMAKCEIDFMSY